MHAGMQAGTPGVLANMYKVKRTLKITQSIYCTVLSTYVYVLVSKDDRNIGVILY